MIKQRKDILIVILFLLLVSLISAYIIEYILEQEPCKLCIYQRFPYFVSILLLSLVSLCGSAIAFYHFGIEQGFFNESLVCETKDLDQNLSKEEVLKQLKENTISCKNVTFRVFGLSLATINTIFSFILFYIFLRLFKNYEVDR